MASEASKAFQAVKNVGFLRDDRAAFVDGAPPNDGHSWYAVVLRDDLLRAEAAHAAEVAALREENERLRTIVAAFRGLVMRVPVDSEDVRLWLGQAMDVMDASADLVTVEDHDRWEAARAALASTNPDAARAEE